MSSLRIAYVCRYDPYANDGVARKIASQVAAWRGDGAEVELFIVGEDRSGASPHAPALAGRHFLYRRPLEKLLMNLRLQRAVLRWRPEVVYLRYSTFLPPPGRLVRAVPTVVEVNSDDRAEYRLLTWPQRAFNTINRLIIFSGARGMACVTPELEARIRRDYPDARTATITNGLDALGPPLPAPHSNERPRLVILASQPYPWHGIDKIISLAAVMKECDFDIVGPSDIRVGDLPPNVHLHGHLSAQGCEAVLANADVALAGLAFHRIGLSQAAPLKVRDYLAHGLPVIIGYDDPDLRGSPWFALALPNRDENLSSSQEAIRDFVARVRGRRVTPEEVAPRIGLAAKERERLRFLAEIAGLKPRRKWTDRTRSVRAAVSMRDSDARMERRGARSL